MDKLKQKLCATCLCEDGEKKEDGTITTFAPTRTNLCRTCNNERQKSYKKRNKVLK
jgi:hypothetical protein